MTIKMDKSPSMISKAKPFSIYADQEFSNPNLQSPPVKIKSTPPIISILHPTPATTLIAAPFNKKISLKIMLSTHRYQQRKNNTPLP